MMDDYSAMVRRMERGIAVWGVLGVAGAWVGWGGLAALGVASGAAAAWANFRWLEKAFASPGSARAGLLILRFALLGVVGYVMLKVFAVSPIAFLAGLFTALGSAVSEALYQVIYARNS